MKLNNKKIIYVGFSFLIICMFWQVYDNIIAKMLINSFGLNQFWSGVVMALDNILALFLLPFFGNISDKTKTKYGKRTPYIFVGVILSAILFVGVSVVDSYQQSYIEENGVEAIVEVIDENDENYGKFIYRGKYYDEKDAAADARSQEVYALTKSKLVYLILFIGILFLTLIAMASYRTPAVSLMPDVTVKPLRSKANAIINLMGTAGGIIALGFMTFLAKDYHSYVTTFVVLGSLMIILLMIFMLKVKEPKLVKEMEEESKLYGLEEESENEDPNDKHDMSKDVRKSFYLILLSIVFWFMAYNAATTKFSDYAGNVLNMGFTIPLLIAQATAVISYIPIGIISSKFGRKKTILVGVVILFIAFLLGTIATKDTTVLIYVTMALAGIGWATINVNSYPMIVEMSKGSNIGKYTGYYYTASMAAQIVTPMLSGYFMDQLGRRVLFPYSVLFCVFAFISMLFVKHGDSKPIPVKTIEAFDIED